jgi:hypothetical protein
MPQNFNYGIDKLSVGNAIAIGSGKIKGILGDGCGQKVKQFTAICSAYCGEQ